MYEIIRGGTSYMKKKALVAAVAAVLAMGIAGSASAAVENVCALTTPGHFGQKLKAVMIEYSTEVDAEKLDASSFELFGMANNLTDEYAAAEIARVYTNSEPALLEEGSVPGNFVIIETSDFDHVGLVADNWFYKDAAGEEKKIAIRKDLQNVYYIGYSQLTDVAAADGSVAGEATDGMVLIDQANITHDTLDEYVHVHLDDETAEGYLKGFTFGNNNNVWSLSSNSTKSNSIGLTEEDLLGDLNEATLSGLGVDIWYRLPKDYDPSKEYPLFLFFHGSGETSNYVKDEEGNVVVGEDGVALHNEGVHFNISKVGGVWGEEDVIFVCPQYYSGNQPREDGYERDDACRIALCYALTEFPIDRDRVFASGTSQGAGRTTALLRDCADYLTGVVIQNGGYSSAIMRTMPVSVGIALHKEIFQYAAAQNVALWWFQGVNDPISNRVIAEEMHDAFVELYQEAGKSEEWIADNVRLTYLNDKLYLDMNESSFHSTMKPTYLWYAYYNDELFHATYSDAEDSLGEYYDTQYGSEDPFGYAGMVDWVLSKTKSGLSE